MANKTVLDFDSINDPQPDDVLYLIRGTDSNRDKKVSIATLLSGVKTALRSLVTNQWDSGATLVAPDAETNDSFGFSVAIDGDNLIVGAPNEDTGGNAAGAAYMFGRTDVKQWEVGAKLVASDAQEGDYFGCSVAISGDYVIVGAYGEDTGGDGAGAAYVFCRTGLNTWDTGTKLVLPDAQAKDSFGGIVAIDGNYAIIGTTGEILGDRELAFVFRRTGPNQWDNGTKLVAPDVSEGQEFGGTVAISGDYAIVGAHGGLVMGGAFGAAYVFRRTGSNAWDAMTKLVEPNAEAGAKFAKSVAISGDYAIVGAEDATVTGLTDAGAAYIFHRGGADQWDAGTKLIAPNPTVNGQFGRSVAISGDYAIVGAYGEDNGSISVGIAYIFRRIGENQWDTGTKVASSNAMVNGQFGRSIAISGDHALVGAHGADAGVSGSGVAHVFDESFRKKVDLL